MVFKKDIDRLPLTNELRVPDHARVELDAQRLRVLRRARAHLLVRRLRGVLPSARVADGRLDDALVLGRRIVLEEDVLDAPEAAAGEGGELGLGGGWGRGRDQEGYGRLWDGGVG